jgi:hypothetical protein
MTPQPKFWGALRSGGTGHMNFILKVRWGRGGLSFCVRFLSCSCVRPF